MPRPQQQQPPLSPPLVRPFARSLSFRSPIRVRFLSLSISPFRVSSLTWDEGKRESAKLPFSITDFLLFLSTLSLSISSSSFFSSLFFSRPLFLSHSFCRIIPRPFSSRKRALRSHFLVRSLAFLFTFFFSRVVSSRALLRRSDLFLARGSYHEQLLTSASNASCRPTSSSTRAYSPRT